MGRSINMMAVAGALIALLGIIGLAMPVFVTKQTSEVAHIGDLKINSQEETPHVIPPLVSGGVLALGVILLAGGLYQRR